MMSTHDPRHRDVYTRGATNDVSTPQQPSPFPNDHPSTDKNNASPPQSTTITTQPTVTVGRMVSVQSRTWPGINKPGGIGRVVGVVHSNDEDEPCVTHVHVKYMVGSHQERHVPIHYVQVATELEDSIQTTSRRSSSAGVLRNRSHILGRCKRCGSLRTDCGSCDWAYDDDGTLPTSSSNKKQSTTRKRTSSRRRQQHHASNDSSSNSSDEEEESDDDDDVHFEELLKLMRKQEETYWKRRRQQKSTSAKQSSPPKQDDDEGSDGSLEDFFAHRQHRYNRAIRHSRYQWDFSTTTTDSVEGSDAEKNKDDDNHDDSHRKRRKVLRTTQRNTGTSVLEQLSATQSTATATTSKKRRHRIVQDDDSPPDFRASATNAISSPTRHSSDESNPSSPVSFSVPQNDAFDDLSSPDVVRRPNAQSVSSYLHASRNESMALGSPMNGARNELALADFIQPEGTTAAENLPDDVTDSTNSIPHGQLPSFFEECASQLEDEHIPDCLLQIAKLKQQWRRLDKSTLLTLKDFHKQCHGAWNEITKTIIRSGTDQCRNALRKMESKSEYKRHSAGLTTSERQQLRKATFREVRDLRMDALEKTVDDLVASLRAVTTDCEDALTSLYDEAEFQDDVDNRSTSDNDEEDYETQDLVPIAACIPTSSTGSTDDADVPFRRHEHASLVRRDKARTTSGRNQKARNQKVRAKGVSKRRRLHKNRHATRRKAPAETRCHNGEHDFSSSTKRSVNRRTTVQPCPEDGIASLREAMDRNVDQSSDQFERPSRGMAKGNAVPTFNIFQERERTSLSRNLADTRGRSQHAPISNRMQAFLDKNKENHLPEYASSGDERTQSLTAARKKQRRKLRAHNKKARIRENQLPEYSSSDDGRVLSATVTQTKRRRKLRTHNKNSQRCELLQQVDDAGSLQVLDRSDDDITTSNHEQGEQRFTSSHPVSLEELLRNLQPNGKHCNSTSRTFGTASSRRVNASLGEDRAVSVSVHRTPAPNSSSIKMTLQQCIAQNSLPLLRDHVGALITFLGLVAERNNDEERSFVLNEHGFVDFVVLQLVDSLYSLFCQEAWALETIGIRNTRIVLQELSPLCEALATRVNLVEASARCIWESLGPQEWHTDPGHTPFVSAVKTCTWREFLTSGHVPAPTSSPRHRVIGKFWPRAEGQAVWGIFAFLGSIPSQDKCASGTRWSLIDRIFSCGILAGPSAEETCDTTSSPSLHHLDCLSADMGILNTLLCKGVLDPLPVSDSLMTNLIKESLVLQSDSYLHNNIAWIECWPARFRTTRTEKRTMGRLWLQSSPQRSGLSPSPLPRVVEVGSFDLYNVSSDNRLTCVSGLLVPSSKVLQICLNTLKSWFYQVSLKPVRLKRFAKAITNICKQLTTATAAAPANQKRGNAHEAAFGNDFPDGHDRKSSFLREAVAWLTVLHCSLSRLRTSTQECLISRETAKQIWLGLAPPSLQTHPASLRRNQQKNDWNPEDSQRSFAAFKVTVTILLLQLNVSPWHLDNEESTISLSEHLELRASRESLDDSIMRILACFDAILQRNREQSILTCACAILSVVIKKLTNLAQAESISGSTLIALQEIFATVALRSLRRKFLLFANTMDGTNASVLPHILCTMRATLTFLLINQKDSSQDSTGEGEPTPIVSVTPRVASSSLEVEELWSTLVSASQQAKPSERFSLQRSHAAGNDLSLSYSGAHMISVNVDKICDCLLSILLLDPSKVKFRQHIMQLLSNHSIGTQTKHSTDDVEYTSAISRRVASQVCSLSESCHGMETLLYSCYETILYAMLDSLLDSSRLIMFSSSNITVMRKKYSDEVAKQELCLLDLFNGDALPENETNGVLGRKMSRYRKRATQVWGQLRSLGRALASMTDDDNHLPKFLSRAIDETIAHHQEEVHKSIETELLHCFQFFSQVLFGRQNNAFCMKFSTRIVASLTKHIIRLLQSLNYQDQTRQDNTIEYQRNKARTSELLEAYTELFFAVVASSGIANQGWYGIYEHIRDTMVVPSLRRDKFNAMEALHQITVRLGQEPSHTEFGSMSSQLTFLDMLSNHAMRRCREWVLIDPSNQLDSTKIQSALYSSLSPLQSSWSETKTICSFIGHSLSPSGSLGRIAGTMFQESLDDAFLQLENQRQHPSIPARVNLTLQLIENFILPSIMQRTSESAKGRALLLVTRLIEQGSLGIGVQDRTIVLMSKLARALSAIVLQQFTDDQVQEELLVASLNCATSLANAEVKNDTRDCPPIDSSFVGWCRESWVEAEGRALKGIDAKVKGGIYLFCFFKVMEQVSLRITLAELRNRSDQLSQLSRVGATKVHVQEESVTPRASPIIPKLDTVLDPLDWIRSLWHVEVHLFESTNVSSQTAHVNVYSRTAPPSDTSSEPKNKLESWNPSRKLLRTAKELVAEVVAAS